MKWWSRIRDRRLERHARIFRDAKADAAARVTATNELVKIGGRAIPHLVAALHDERRIAEPAAKLLARLRAVEAADAVWEAFVRQRIRWEAAAEAMAVLRSQPASDGERALQLVAAGDYRAAARLGLAALPVLTDALNWNDRDDARAAVARALVEIGPAALPLLLDVCFTQEAEFKTVRKSAIDALDAIDPRWRTSAEVRARTPEALQNLQHKSIYFRRTAACALGALRLRDAIPALVSLLADEDETVMTEAVRALGAIGDRSAIEPLTAFARNASGPLRQLAVDELRGLGVEPDIGPDHRQTKARQRPVSLIVFRPGPAPSVTDGYGQLIADCIDGQMIARQWRLVGVQRPVVPIDAISLYRRLAAQHDVPDFGWGPGDTFEIEEPGTGTRLTVLVFEG